jgi:hypothetical protein
VHTEHLFSTWLFLKKNRTSLNLNVQCRSENALQTPAPKLLSNSQIPETEATPMPKNKVSDPITDQEIAFARLVLSGAMTDRRAAEAVGLNPDSAAYTKSKPHVRAYMLEHRAAVEQQLVQQEAEGLHRLNLDREKVLARLWEIANLSPEMTRSSITGQVKALSMIIAIEGLIPDRRAADRLSVSSHKNSTPAPTHLQPSPAPPVPACRGAQQEDALGVPEPKLASSPMVDPPPHSGQSTSAIRCTPAEVRAPYVPLFTSIPDLGIPFFKNINPFVHPR